MNIEDRKNYSEAIKNIVVAVSIVLGGLWDYYTFNSRLEAQNAKVKLALSEQQLMQRPVIVPNIETFISPSSSPEKWLLKILINFENKGNTDARIFLNDKTVRVAKVEIANGTISGFKNKITTGIKAIKPQAEGRKYIEVKSICVLVGQHKSMISIVEIEEPGLYQIEFVGIPGRTVKAIREKTDAIKEHLSRIYVGDYVLLDPSPKAFSRPCPSAAEAIR